MGATHIAKCCCGACSITVDGEPVLNGICHCTSCKKRTGIAGGCFADEPMAAPNLSASHNGRCAWLSVPDGWLTTP